MRKKWLPLLPLICFCTFLLISCGPPATDIHIGCSTAELIDAINTANETPTLSINIHLSTRCVYEFTDIDHYDYDSSGVALPSITSPVVINGNFATIKRSEIAGTPEFRLFFVDSTGELTIEKISLEGGNVASSESMGGAILNHGFLSINNSEVFNNEASSGGGIYSFGGEFSTFATEYYDNSAKRFGGAISTQGQEIYASIDSCTFHNNHATISGGGVMNYNANTNITNSHFIENSAGSGGAVDNADTPVPGSNEAVIENCSFTNNTAVNYGGAIANSDFGFMSILECSFDGNSASYGGAISNLFTLSMGSCSITNNTAENAGGGIYIADFFDSQTLSIINTTISGNQVITSSTSGGSAISQRIGNLNMEYITIANNSGGIAVQLEDGSTSIVNSIVANNPDGDCGGSAIGSLDTMGEENLDSDGSCTGFTITDDPMLLPLANNGGNTLTHRPEMGSPVLEVVTDASVTIDQISQSRPAGLRNDLGAYELQDIMPGVHYPETTPRFIETIPVPLDEEQPESPLPDINWQFEGFVCSDIGLTEFYIKTTAAIDEFHITINEKETACYQQSYDQARYWCHVEKQPLGWEVPVEVVYCLGNDCTTISRTTLSESRCESPEAPNQPEPVICDQFMTQNDCGAAPGCMWACEKTPNGEWCACENSEQ